MEMMAVVNKRGREAGEQSRVHHESQDRQTRNQVSFALSSGHTQKILSKSKR